MFSYSESEFSQNINSDGYGQYFSKLKQSLNQLKQHDRCFVPEYFDCDDLAMNLPCNGNENEENPKRDLRKRDSRRVTG